jgi:hypothetical protein
MYYRTINLIAIIIEVANVILNGMWLLKEVRFSSTANPY